MPKTKTTPNSLQHPSPLTASAPPPFRGAPQGRVLSHALFIILLTLISSTPAQSSDKIPLFNGKDLDGWSWHTDSKHADVKHEDVWSVHDGLLHCKGSPPGYIQTDKTYTSFLLHVEWRFIKEGNGGVLIRKTGEDKVWPKSLECQLLSKNAGDIWNIDNFPATLDQSRTHGRQTVKLLPTNEKPVSAKEWNTYDILMDGHDLTLRVNGVVQNTAKDVEIVNGNILLQSEGGEIEYQNIWIVPLPDEGMDKSLMKGWHQLGSGTWTVEDGAIVGRHRALDKDYGHLVSDSSYKDFKATFKVKCLAGNSGWYFHSHPEGLTMHGIQAEVDEKKNNGGLYESYGRQWLPGSPPPPDIQSKSFKPQDWNDYTVESKDNHITVTINNITTSDLIDEQSPKEGVFALQLHTGDGEVLFKDIAIEGKPLPTATASLSPSPLVGEGRGEGLAPHPKDPSLSNEIESRSLTLFNSLTPEQKSRALLAYDDKQRNDQTFTPGLRAGIPLKDLTDDQRTQALNLLTLFTSDYGKQKSLAIANQDAKQGGINKYFLAFFGQPGKNQTFAWRIAEHHLTLVDIEFQNGHPTSFGPILLGANPSTLFDEDEDAMIALYHSLTIPEAATVFEHGAGASSAPLGLAGVPVYSLSPDAQAKVKAVLDSRLRFFSPDIKNRITTLIENQGGLTQMKLAFYGQAEKKCRDGGKWDFKLGNANFLCDYENSRGHIHMSLKATDPSHP